MQQIIGGEKYDTETADLVGSDLYWDGHNWQRHGMNTYLYKTKNGVFFLHKTTIWQGERASIEVVSVDEAKDWYGRLPESKMGYKDAFGVELVEARSWHGNKILVELSKDEHPTSGEVFGVLDIQAHMIGPAEHVKIRDEIAELALDSGPRNIVYTHMDADSLKVKIKDADEDKVRRFEEAGWT